MIKDTRFPNFHNDPAHKSRHPSLKNRFRKAVCINWLLQGGAAHEHVSNETLLTRPWFQTRFLGFDRDKTTYRREIGNGFVMHLWNNSINDHHLFNQNQKFQRKEYRRAEVFSGGVYICVHSIPKCLYCVNQKKTHSSNAR